MEVDSLVGIISEKIFVATYSGILSSLLGGSPNEFGPDFLIERDIILVHFNYRVGMFGFMSLGTPEISGNMGLKDQQLALRWTYENIEYFGGDKNKITLSGQSAGMYMLD